MSPTKRASTPRLGKAMPLLALVGVLVVTLVAAIGVFAYWTADGTGSAAASVSALDAPSITSATPGAGTVVLTWSTVTPPGAGAVSYVVQRDGGNPSGNCPTFASPTAATTCTDSGLTAGTYSYTVTATWSGWTATSTTSSVTVSSGAATHLVLAAATTTPTSGAADSLTITAKDAANVTVTGYTGDKSLTFSGASTIGSFQPTVTDKNGTARTFGSAGTLTFANGVAAVSGSSNGVMKLYKAETANIVVSDGSIDNGAGLAVTVTAGAATQIALTGSTATLTSGSTRVLTATIQDAAGNTVATGADATRSVTFAQPSGAGSVTGLGASTASGGVATKTVTGSLADAVNLQASATLTGGATSSNLLGFTVTFGAAAQLAFTTSPSGASGGVAFSTQPVVTVKDAAGNTVTSDSSTVTLSITAGTPASGGPGTLSGCSQSEAGGVVTFSGCRIDTVGTGYRLHAVDGSLTAADSSTFTVTVGAAAKLAFTQQPSGSTGGVAFGTQPKVTVQDAGGNTVTGNTSAVTLALTTPAGATLSCTANPVAAVLGVATFAGCKVDLAGSYTLTATGAGLTPAVSNSFAITVGAAAKLGFTQQPSGSTGGVAFGTQPKVAIQDLGGNTVTGNTSSVTLALTTPGGATFSCTTNPLAAVAGVATFAGCKVDLVGTYTLTATVGGLTSAVSTSITIVVGPAAKLAFTQQPSGATASVAFGTQPKVTIQDLGGNTVTSDTSPVTLTLTVPAGATLACTSNPLAAVAGVATFAACEISLAGTYTLTATDGSLASAVSTSITITAPNTMTARATGNWNAKTTWQGVTKTGTITTSVFSTSVTGTGTAFTTQLAAGDVLYQANGTTLIGTVASIASNTTLTLTGNAAVSQTSLGYAATTTLPTATHAVSVVGAFTVTIPTGYAAVANSLTVGSSTNATLQTIAFAAATSSLTTSGDVTMRAPNAGATRNLPVNAGTLTVGGNLSLSAGASSNASTRINRVTITTGTVTVGGNLVFNAGNFLSVSALQNQIVMSGGAGTFNLAGAFTINSGGGIPSGTLTPGTTSTFNFNGSAAQTVPIGVSSIVYNNLHLNNTSAAGATLGAAISATNVTGNVRVLSGTFDNGGFAIVGNAADAFEVANGAMLELTGTSTMATGFGTETLGASGTVDYAGTAQTVSNEAYGNLSLSGSGVKTMPATGPTIAGSFSISGTASVTAAAALTVNGSFSVGSGSTFNASTFSHTVKGSFSNSGTFGAETSTFTFNGASPQTIGGSTATTFNNLTIGNAVSLSGVDTTVGATLALGGSILATGSNEVIASGTVTRTTGFVNGNLQKPIAAGASTPVFEIGTGATYAPVSLSLTGASAGGSLTASSTVGQHPSFGASGISPTKYVNRYWTLSAGGGLTVTGYTGTFTFVAADLVGAPNTAALIVRSFVTPSTWTAASSPSSTATTVTGVFATSFGDYAAGE